MAIEVNYLIRDPVLNVRVAALVDAYERGVLTPETPPEGATEPGDEGLGFFEAECKAARGGMKRTVYIPVGSKLRHTYKGHTLEAFVVSPTTVMFDGDGYENLTAAAFAAAKTINPMATRPNGCYWWARETAPGVWTTLYRT